jgi:hypothetical protein
MSYASELAALATQLAALVAGDRAEAIGQERFVPVLELSSGARLALTVGVDSATGPGEPAWLIVEDGKVTAFTPASAIAFVEPLEQPRGDFDAALERGAAAAGLPGEAVLFSFPAVELARALLARGQPYFSRLVLLWLLPSELRPLKAEIAQVAQNDELPQAVRDVARRLVVPE